jgi:hypothetical protein
MATLAAAANESFPEPGTAVKERQANRPEVLRSRLFADRPHLRAGLGGRPEAASESLRLVDDQRVLRHEVTKLPFGGSQDAAHLARAPAGHLGTAAHISDLLVVKLCHLALFLRSL